MKWEWGVKLSPGVENWKRSWNELWVVMSVYQNWNHMWPSGLYWQGLFLQKWLHWTPTMQHQLQSSYHPWLQKKKTYWTSVLICMERYAIRIRRNTYSKKIQRNSIFVLPLKQLIQGFLLVKPTKWEREATNKRKKLVEITRTGTWTLKFTIQSNILKLKTHNSANRFIFSP